MEPILPYLMLDEVKNPNNWHGGIRANVPMKKLYTFFDGLTPPGTGFQVNRDKVSKAEVSNWQDLFKPKWKGKFGIYLPRRIATASIAMACLRPGFKSDKEWEGFVGKLFAQQPVSAPRSRAVADWLIKGRYDIVVAAGGSYLDRLTRKTKANVDDPVGDNFCGTSPSGTGRSLSVVKNPPHPNAAKVFVNWYLTKETQDELVKAYWKTGAESVSRRKDAGHPDPAFQQKAVKDFLSGWMNGKGLMTTSDVGLRLQKKVMKIAKDHGY